MARATISAGACGYTAVVEVKKLEGRNLKVNIISDCKMLQAMAEELEELDWSRQVLDSFRSSRVYKAAEKHVKHVSCPVPSAVLKTIEVEIGIALPNEVKMRIEKDSTQQPPQ